MELGSLKVKRSIMSTTNNQDLQDNPGDEEKMKPETFIIDMPEVKDIPGQEHIHPPSLGELADTTISSSDEEGEGILDALDDNPDSYVSPTGTGQKVTNRLSKETLEGVENQSLKTSSTDDVDDEKTPLNEKSFDQDLSGGDLDIPGSELDDADEAIGEEDEENNDYSISDNQSADS